MLITWELDIITHQEWCDARDKLYTLSVRTPHA
jgi:hypothetical protein